MNTMNENAVLAVDRFGRAITVPEGQPLPDGAVEVDQETWNKIVAGAPRVFTKEINGRIQYSVSQGGMTWAPTFDPGPGWVEVTDPDEIDRILYEMDNPSHSDDDGGGPE